MTASLYQSGSATDSLALPGMRVTFAAQSTPRNDPLACSARSTRLRRTTARRAFCRVHRKKKRPRCRGRFLKKLNSRLSLNFHDLGGDALPLAIAQHPGIGEAKAAIEAFAVLACALFMRGPDHHRHIWTITMHG